MMPKLKIRICYFAVSLMICVFSVSTAESNTIIIPDANTAIERAGFVAIGKIF
jgi:hypothetical protein